MAIFLPKYQPTMDYLLIHIWTGSSFGNTLYLMWVLRTKDEREFPLVKEKGGTVLKCFLIVL